MRVLLVEQDARDATLIREMLAQSWAAGLVITHAGRLGDAAQELLEHRATCVLLGLPVSGIDPLLALEHVRTVAPDVPVVMLARDGNADVPVLAVGAGAQDFLLKGDLNANLLGRTVRYAIERKRTEVQLAHQALHDQLTRLPNRALFLDRLGVALDRSRRTGASVAVLFLDVDEFKTINDSFGHAAGDRLLVALADRLRSMLRPMDTIARFGGDEFTFLFEDLASEREVVLIAERISRAASLPLRFDDRETVITVSIGIAMASDASVPPEMVIREADAAMYRAKELGRSRYELFDEVSRERASARLELEGALRHALEAAELRVHYHPWFRLGEKAQLEGFEALVRWEHPERGLIGPDQFIRLAEETGLVIPLGEYVLSQALRQCERWRKVKPDVTLSLNLSSRQLEDAGLVTMLLSAIGATGADPSVLCLEVSEATVAEDPDATLRALQALKAAGLTIAIDDYGTGNSSLASLKRMPVDALKIHQSFVSGVGAEGDEGQLVGAVVELAHALGLTAVAEGVETDTQLSELRELGCDEAQGYLFGRPVPEEEAEALLVGR